MYSTKFMPVADSGRSIPRVLIGLVLLAALPFVVSAQQIASHELTIATGMVDFTGKQVEALTVNGGIPGPTLHFNEGDLARIQVHNELNVPSSVHWHGLLLPADQDGVPAVAFPGIAPNSTFIYEFPLKQAGTYWYHSHSGLQEQRGVYGSIVVHPKAPERHLTDSDHVLMLSEWTNQNPEMVLGQLKSGNEYYSITRGTTQSIFGAIARKRFGDYLHREWQSMPDNEIADVAHLYA